MAGYYSDKPKLYRISDERELVLYRALMYKGVEDSLQSNIQLLSLLLPHSVSEHDYKQRLSAIDDLVRRRYYLKLQDFDAVDKMESRKKKVETQGLTGDKEVDKMIKMYRLLKKAGIVKDDEDGGNGKPGT